MYFLGWPQGVQLHSAVAVRAFPARGVGGGLVSNTCFNLQNEMGASFLCPLGLVVIVVGKNTEARYEFVVYTLVSNHLILILIFLISFFFFFFTWVGGGVVCSKGLETLHML